MEPAALENSLIFPPCPEPQPDARSIRFHPVSAKPFGRSGRFLSVLGKVVVFAWAPNPVQTGQLFLILEQPDQVFAVAALHEVGGEAFELLSIDEPFPVGHLFDAADLQALPLFDDADELGRLHE